MATKAATTALCSLAQPRAASFIFICHNDIPRFPTATAQWPGSSFYGDRCSSSARSNAGYIVLWPALWSLQSKTLRHDGIKQHALDCAGSDGGLTACRCTVRAWPPFILSKPGWTIRPNRQSHPCRDRRFWTAAQHRSWNYAGFSDQG